MKKTILLFLAMFSLAFSWTAIADDPTGSEQYRYYVERIYAPSTTLRLQTGFEGIACTPDDFMKAIRATIDYSNPDEDCSRYHAALSFAERYHSNLL